MVESNRQDPMGGWGVGTWKRTEWEGAWMV